MRKGLGLTILAALLAGACGGSNGAPTSPSNGNPAPGSAAGSAIITGSVQGATSAMLAASTGVALAGVTVAVVGTSISSMADVAGRFTLMNVPAGAVQLRLSGGGADATVSLSPVAQSQTVDVVLAVSGSTASVESEVRSGAGEAQLEGRVESLPPTMAPLTFKAAGRAVKTDAGTRFVDGSQSRTFTDLRLGMRVHAKGTLAGDSFTATVVELQNSNTSLPVIVNGTIDTLTGSASAFQFKIGSRVVKGDALTTFFGDGDKPDSFASLKEGSRVEVKGEQRDDFVYAVRIHINGSGDDDDGDGQDSSASIHGTLNAIGGAKPLLVLTVGTTIVRTSASTEVKRRGDVQTLDALKVGQSVHVVGVRQPDGSLNARKIEINDDATGGEFEIEGSVGGLKGTCPSVEFSVNGFSVKTSGATTFEGGACSALKSGDKVSVKGTRQADGSVAATRVTRK
jgi:hypothetical protein